MCRCSNMKWNEALKHRLMTMCAAAGLALASCGKAETSKESVISSENCPVELVVLGIGQDAGAPQIGNPNDPAWTDPSKKLWATSLALIDHENGKRYLFEATPDIREQIQYLDEYFPGENKKGLGIDGIFLTHAHIGHYAGLMFLGRESAGTSGVPVYAMPRMKGFLENNGPWSQMVELGNIKLNSYRDPITFNLPIELSGEIIITPFLVPHRDEYSETVGFLISNSNSKALFIPDIDGWQEWQSVIGASFQILPRKTATGFSSLLAMMDKVDYAFLDATFYDDNELSGRDMSQIPHPRVTESMDIIDAVGDDSLKDKVRFIHINHTNPLRDHGSEAYKAMTKRGYKVAKRGERFCL